MLTAQQARELHASMQSMQAEAIIINILQEVAERAISPCGKNYLYFELGFVDDRASQIIDKLTQLGYKVDRQDFDEEYCSLDIKW